MSISPAIHGSVTRVKKCDYSCSVTILRRSLVSCDHLLSWTLLFEMIGTILDPLGAIVLYGHVSTASVPTFSSTQRRYVDTDSLHRTACCDESCVLSVDRGSNRKPLGLASAKRFGNDLTKNLEPTHSRNPRLKISSTRMTARISSRYFAELQCSFRRSAAGCGKIECGE